MSHETGIGQIMTNIPWNPLASALNRASTQTGGAGRGDAGAGFQARLDGLTARGGGVPDGSPLDARLLATLARLVQQRLAYGGMAILSGGQSPGGMGGMGSGGGIFAGLSGWGAAGAPGGRQQAQPARLSEALSRLTGRAAAPESESGGAPGASAAPAAPGSASGASNKSARVDSEEGSDNADAPPERKEGGTVKTAVAPAASEEEEGPYADLIREASDRHDLPEELIRSVIRVESDFQHDAVSSAGAQGLMQLMPETAKDLGVTDPFDPRQNIMGGSRYLKQLLSRYDGDRDMALAAYNWGMGNLERHPERMPDETVRYVHKVNSLLA
ncbi:lytic transglycosylase domain-containing protein [Thiohalorhabdus sp. Cl-TMA]|uniref:Lytic transglycosylase domain-containing protein n=1 Tax=Thiohalorhabdus methylotrophus TaxID=3242694 RepID=A0ABV4TTD3_9GAMM